MLVEYVVKKPKHPILATSVRALKMALLVLSDVTYGVDKMIEK
jgi:hypothetical protein